MIGHTRKPS